MGEVRGKRKVQGIVFDMDNTLLKSNIDFAAMKKETFRFLSSRGVLSAELDLNGHTSSTLIAAALQTRSMSAALIRDMWEIPRKYEMAGMHQAELEPGVTELLSQLRGKYYLTVVTNNSIEAADRALRNHRIQDCFDYIVGREGMESLKPAPDGFLHILQSYGNTAPEEWISVGDSWIDGKASAEAGVAFISYRGDLAKMNRMGVYPVAHIDDIRRVLDFI